MAFSDSSFEQNRSRIIGKPLPKITGSVASKYIDPSFEDNRLRVISAPKPKQQVKFIAPTPVSNTQKISFKLGQAKQVVKQITDKVKMTFVEPQIKSPVVLPKEAVKPKVEFIKPMPINQGQKFLNKEQMDGIKNTIKSKNIELGETLRKVVGLPLQYQIEELEAGKKKKYTGSQIAGGWIENAIAAVAPSQFTAGRGIASKGFDLVKGFTSGSTFVGLHTLIDVMKEERSDFKDLLTSFGVGFFMGATEPNLVKDITKSAEVGYKQTLSKFGFKNNDYKSPEVLKSKFRQVVMKLHPDKGGSAEEYKQFIDAYNNITSAAVSNRWSLPDVNEWTNFLWEKGGKTPQELMKLANDKFKTFVENTFKKKKNGKEIIEMLPDGEVTPQEVINIVMKSGLEETPEGKLMMQAALDAKTRDMNIKLETGKLSEKIRLPEKFSSPEEEKSLTSLKEDPIKFRDEYIAKNGSEINPDLMRKMFPEYKGHNATSFDRFAGALTEVVYDKMLDKNKGLGNNTVLFTAGGPGSAKSTLLNNIEFAGDKKDFPVILDTTFSSKRSLSQVGKALDEGYDVKLVYILRDPLDAWTNGVLPRTKDLGRVITEKYFLEAHDKARLNAIEAYNKFKSNTHFEIIFVDNRLGPGKSKAISVDEVKAFSYNRDKALGEIASETDKYGQKELTKEQYEATKADRDIRTKGRESDQLRSEKQSKDELTSKKPSKPTVGDEFKKEINKHETADSFRTAIEKRLTTLQKSETPSSKKIEILKQALEFHIQLFNKYKRGQLSQLEERLNELVGYAPMSGNWKQEYYLRGAYIDEALANAPEEIKSEVLQIQAKLDTIRYDKIEEKESGFYNKVQDASRKDDYSQSSLFREEAQKSSLKYSFKKNGYFIFPNAEIKSPADIAYAFRELQHNAIESAYIIGLKGGKPVAIELISMGTINASLINPAEMVGILQKKKIESYYVLHNHPSGNPDPSTEDVSLSHKINSGFSNLGFKFEGHVIIDTNEYGFIDPDFKPGKSPLTPPEKTKETEVPVYKKYLEWEGSKDGGTEIFSPKDLAEFSKGFTTNWEKNALIVYGNIRNQVTASNIVPKSNVNLKTIVEGSDASRGPTIFVVNSGLGSPEMRMLEMELKELGFTLQDFVNVGKDGFTSSREIGVMDKGKSQYQTSLLDITGKEKNTQAEVDKSIKNKFEKDQLKKGDKGLLGTPLGNLLEREINLELTDGGLFDEAPLSKKPEGIASTGAKSVGEFEKRDLKPGSEEFKMFEKVQGLIKKYASTVGEGYLSRRAAGNYYPDTTNIRLKGINNLSVAAHEITHFLDFHYKISDRLQGIRGYTSNGNPLYEAETSAFRKEITDLYVKFYGGKKTDKLSKRMIEGFAELLQQYAEAPKQTTTLYPSLVKEFLTVGGKFYEPVMGEIIKDLDEIIVEYQGLPALDKIGTKVVNKTLESKRKDLLNIGEKIRTFIEDDIYPVEKIAKLSGTHFTEADPSLWLRAFQNAAGIYANNVRNPKLGYYGMNSNGEFVKLHDFNWKTLMDHLNKSKIIEPFGNYLVARDQYFEWKELDKLKKESDSLIETWKAMDPAEGEMVMDTTGASLKEQMIEALREYREQLRYLQNNGFTRDEIETAYVENKELFSEEEKIYDTLVREDLKLLNNPVVQLITPETYRNLSEKEGYASMKRKLYDDIVGEGNPLLNQPGGTKASSLKGRTGGEQMIINPVLNGMTNHIEIVRKSMKQAIYNRIGELAQSAKLPDFFQKIALRPMVDQAGKISYPQERDPNIIMSRINYKRVPIVTDLVVKKTIDDALTYQTMNVIEHILITSSRLFTLGTTGLYPAFALVNFPADQWNALLNTRNGYTPVLDQIGLLFKKVTGEGGEVARIYNEWSVLGGDRMTLFQANFGSMDQALKYLKEEENGLRKVLDLLNKGVDIFSIPSKISETASRFAEFYKARKTGKHQLVALEEAGRVTAPFHHVGSWKLTDQVSAKYLFRSAPFANASLQVLAQTVRSTETPEGKKRFFFLMMTMIGLGLASAGLVSQFGSDDQKEQYKDLHPTDLANFIHLPYFSGNGLVRVKVSNQMTTLMTVMEMILAQNLLGAKYSVDDYKQAVSQWVPDQYNILDPIRLFLSWLPPIIKIPFELIANIKDYPNVRPIESQAMMNREPKDRYNEYTSGLAKIIGEKFNLSPLKLDFLMEGLGSRFVRFFTAKPGAYSPASSVYREYYFTLGRRVEDYYQSSATTEQKLKTLKDKLKSGESLSPEERTTGKSLLRKQAIQNEIDARLKIYRGLDIVKDVEKAKAYRDRILDLFEMLDK